MQSAGNDLFARSMLAGDENVRIAGPYSRYQFQHRLHSLGFGYKRRPALRLQQTIFGLEVLSALQSMAELHLGAQDTHQPLVFPGFLYEISSAAAHGLYRDIDASPGRHHNHRQSAVQRLDFRE